MRIIGIHGYKASPDINFWPWLKRELEKEGHEVIIPTLPNPDEPDRDVWIQTLLDAVGTLDKNDVIVGHSLGAAVALRFLEAAPARTTPHACILISPPWMIQDERFRGFFLTELDFEVIMWRASKFVVIHAKNDKVIPVAHGERYKNVFHARVLTPETGEHFQAEEYPILIDTIRETIAEPVVYAPGASLHNEYDDVER